MNLNVPPQPRAALFSVSKKPEKYVVIANQCRNTGVAILLFFR